MPPKPVWAIIPIINASTCHRVLDEITQEETQIKALIVIGEPLQRLPQSQKLAEAYQKGRIACSH